MEAVEAAAERLVRGAMAQLAAGDAPAAGTALGQAYALHHDPFVGLLLGFLDRNFNGSYEQNWDGEEHS